MSGLALANQMISFYLGETIRLTDAMPEQESLLRDAIANKKDGDAEEAQRVLNMLKQLFRMASDFLTSWKDIAKSFLEQLKMFNEFLSSR